LGGDVAALATMRISAKVDYAVRAIVELAAHPGERISADVIAERQSIPLPFLVKILYALRMAGIVSSFRGGTAGGHSLSRDPGDVTFAEVIRVLDGSLTSVHGFDPDAAAEAPEATVTRINLVWRALDASINDLLESVTIADIVAGDLPSAVLEAVGASAPTGAASAAGR
jgi:Rrf2 family protein